MITKVSKNIQRAKSKSHVGLLKLITVLYLLDDNKSLKKYSACKELITRRLIEINHGTVFVT